MDDRIVALEEYKKNIKNKQDLEHGIISVDDLSFEEIEDIKKQYQREIISIDNDIQKLVEENKRLRKKLEK